jgi:uncharacterized protein (DUF488 family)
MSRSASRSRTPRPLYTIGHSTRTTEELIGILQGAKVTRLVDIRSIPRSRTNPQFNEDVLPKTLAQAGIGYLRLAALGGRRGKRKLAPHAADAEAEAAKNAGWEVQAFRNYADYCETPEFRRGLSELLELAREETCAIMCAEAVWWRCHRRIVTDYVLARGVQVVHLLSLTTSTPATMTPFAVVGTRGRISYPAPSPGADAP